MFVRKLDGKVGANWMILERYFGLFEGKGPFFGGMKGLFWKNTLKNLTNVWKIRKG